MRRRAMRLRFHDYSSAGLYFVTLCTRGRQCMFGEVDDSEVHLSTLGAIARNRLLEVPRHHPAVNLDAFVVMPSHIHAIFVLRDRSSHVALGTVLGTYKAAVSRTARRGAIWQRGYYDHVVRDDDDLERIREYIATNPIRWALDAENPAVKRR